MDVTTVNDLMNYVVPIVLFIGAIIYNIKKSLNAARSDENLIENAETYPRSHQNIYVHPSKTSAKKIYKQPVIKKSVKTHHDTYGVVRKNDSSRNAYRLNKKVEISKGEMILTHLRTNKDMVVLSEILSPPKGLRPPY